MSRAYHAIAHHRGLTLGLIAGLFAAIAVVGIRGEETRNVTNRIVQQSPCTAAPSSAACQKAKNETDRARSIGETCIIFHKVGYNCPVGPKKKKVVRQQGSNPSQQPGPSGDGLNGSTNPPVPSTPEQPPKGNDGPQPSPPDPSPPSPPPPVSPAPQAKPLIDLTPITEPVCHLTAALVRICN